MIGSKQLGSLLPSKLLSDSGGFGFTPVLQVYNFYKLFDSEFLDSTIHQDERTIRSPNDYRDGQGQA